jgi:beta-lactamase regulating signal transducer with metallopeptidase domain
MNEVVTALLRANIAAVLAIVLVLALRLPFRRWMGAEAAYCLWLLPLIAAIAAIAPARRVVAALPSVGAAVHLNAAGLGWLCGALAIAAWFTALQVYYSRLARRGQTGPAVVGVVTPRIHMPGDDGAFTMRERLIIRAHEREHIARSDPAWNAVLALSQCLFWFNPFVHLAARLMREDQELACDAAVLRRHAPSRAAYAGALLKAQMQAHPMPLGASWLAGGGHPLESRIAELARRAPRASVWTPIVMMGAAVAVAAATWSLQPPAAHMAPPASLGPMMAVLMFAGLGIMFGSLFLLTGLDAQIEVPSLARAGAPPSNRFQRAKPALTVGVTSVIAMIVMGSTAWQARSNHIAEEARWREIGGSPCDAVANPSPAWLGGVHPMSSFTFEGVRFWRKYGDLECTTFADGTTLKPGRATACQFYSPGIVGVQQAGGVRYFATPAGRRATIRIDAAGASCIVGGRLSGSMAI